MMGEATDNLDQPITKTTSAIIVLPSDHPVVTRKTQSLDFDLRKIQAICCQCDYCTLVCPRTLLGHNFKPHLVMRQISMGLPFSDSPGITGAKLCCNCDLCGVYSCPMNLPIGRLNKQVAEKMKELGWDNPPGLSEYSPPPMRKYSLIPVSRLTSRLRLKEYDRAAPILDSDFQPKIVTIPLKQHIGQPAQSIVNEKQKVKAGDLIGDIDPGTMGARIHASISGIIKSANNDHIIISAY